MGRSKPGKFKTLDASTFVVLGEDLAAGVGHFSLTSELQTWSFPAQLAQQLGTQFKQPELEAPGLGNIPGIATMPPLVPDLMQSTVRKDFSAQQSDLSNLSVPGFTLADALITRPEAPLVDRKNSKQTLVNFILGLPGLLTTDATLPTQVEYAISRKPTLALVELGFHEVVDAAIAGDAKRLPEVDTFRSNYARLFGALRGAQLVVTTIPNPLDTAHFSPLETAAKITKTKTAFLKKQFGLKTGDILTLKGLYEVGYQFTAREVTGKLPEGSVLSSATCKKITQRVQELNRVITTLAEERGALAYDLHGFFKKLNQKGSIIAENQRLNSDYLGGFFLLNGLFPGATGHTLIANDILEFLNRETGSTYGLIDVSEVASQDANTLCRLAPGPAFTEEFLEPRTPAELPPMPEIDPAQVPISPIQTIYPDTPFDFGGMKKQAGCAPLEGVPAGGLSDPQLKKPLVLPKGLEQVLDLNPQGSYFGDALRAVDVADEEPFLTLPDGMGVYFGVTGNVFFGGLAMTDSRLNGKVHIKFSEPDSEGITRFEITHPGGLMGENGTLAAPQLFRLPSQLNMVMDVPGLISSGNLNLNTGFVTNLHYNVLFMNTAILSLFGVNPNLPALPMTFPGYPNSGSTWAKFEQRKDGKLDVTFAGNMFLPLGPAAGEDPIRFPLPFGNPMMQCASIVTRGTSLHPHLHFTTKEDLGPEPEKPIEIPSNTVQEFTAFTHNSSFGDVFGLSVDELGGEGTGRAHLTGRLRVQFGPKFGDSIPLAISLLPPGGLLSEDPQPLPLHPPGTPRGMAGFNELLKFPKLTYPQSGLSCSMDANNLALGAINLKTGQISGELLHRAWVVQALFMALVQVEPCTPSDSFLYQGPANFEQGANGANLFRFNGEVMLPYPEGFKFPSPDGSQGFVVTRPSRLDPFLRLQAMADTPDPHGVLEGGEKLVSSIGELFSFEYAIPLDPQGRQASFSYTNHTGGGTFELATLSWLSCTNSRGARSAKGKVDTITFGGFGTWSEDPSDRVHQVSVQISTASKFPYVGIQVDGGLTSNVNTKPQNIEDTMP